MQHRKIRGGGYARIVFTPDGGSLFTLGRNVVKWDLATGKRLGWIHPFSHTSSLTFNGDGSLMLLKNTSGELVTVRTHDLAVMSGPIANGHGEGNAPVYWAPQKTFLIPSWSGHLTARTEHLDLVWDQPFGRMLGSLVADAGCRRIVTVRTLVGAHPVDEVLTSTDDLRTWDYWTLDLFDHSRLDGMTPCIFTPDGARLVSLSRTTRPETDAWTIAVTEIATGRIERRDDNTTFSRTDLTMSPDGTRLAIIESEKGWVPFGETRPHQISVRDVLTLDEVDRLDIDASHISYSPIDNTLAASTPTGVVLIDNI